MGGWGFKNWALWVGTGVAHCEQGIAGKTSWDHYPQSPPSPALGTAPQFSKHFYMEVGFTWRV